MEMSGSTYHVAEMTTKTDQVLDAARGEASRRGMDISLYRTVIATEGELIQVSFIDKDVPEQNSFRGSPGRHPAFTVTIDGRSNLVVRFVFER